MGFPANLGTGNPNDTIGFLQTQTQAAEAVSEAAAGNIFGTLSQPLNPGRFARSNGEWAGTAALIATNKLVAAEGETTVVAVPVVPGDVFQHVLVPVGATAGEKVEEGYAALYEGKAAGKLLAQSKSAAFAETFKKEEGFVFTLESPVTVTEENAPGGFLYVQINLATVTVIPTIVSVVGPSAAAAKAIGASGTGKPPTQFAAKTGTGKKATAEATLGTLTNIAYIPIVALY